MPRRNAAWAIRNQTVLIHIDYRNVVSGLFSFKKFAGFMLFVTAPVRLETAPTGPEGLQIWVKNGQLNYSECGMGLD